MSGRSGASTQWTRVEHGFGPLFDARSRVLFLGTMASPKSREAGFFYMHPRNRIWPIMDALFADPHDPDDKVGATRATRRAFALRHRFALWDTVESCEILGASDASIRNVVPSDLTPIIRGSQIRHIYPCGTKAMQLYERLCRPLLLGDGIDLPVTALPSTSPAYASKTLADLIGIYRSRIDMSDFV